MKGGTNDRCGIMSKVKGRKRPKRKLPITVNVVVGMLESSAQLDGAAAERRRIEAAGFGKSRGFQRDRDGKTREVVDISGGYSIGITQSAQVLAGLAAELALKYAYETDNPDVVTPPTHKLYDKLYSKLSTNRRNNVEADYAVRTQRHHFEHDEGWKTAKQVFQSANDYFEKWRYVTEEDIVIAYSQPVFLREAICSVVKTLGVNISWSEPASRPE